jgi:HAD superfamily hydrolase (TIGR01490 family)
MMAQDTEPEDSFVLACDPAKAARIRVALFDLDRTLIRSTSAELYTRFRRDLGEVGPMYSLKVAWLVMQYTFGVIHAEQAAKSAVAEVIGKPEVWLRDRCRRWYDAYVRSEVYAHGRALVRHHQALGHHVAIVTASSIYAAEPVAEDLGIDQIIATELEIVDGVFSGGLVPPLCYREGKVTRVERWFASRGLNFDEAIFYTDSVTDRPLLERVACPVVVNADRRLARLARKRGWPMQRW